MAAVGLDADPHPDPPPFRGRERTADAAAVIDGTGVIPDAA